MKNAMKTDIIIKTEYHSMYNLLKQITQQTTGKYYQFQQI
jgi:hypothetical protein